MSGFGQGKFGSGKFGNVPSVSTDITTLALANPGGTPDVGTRTLHVRAKVSNSADAGGILRVALYSGGTLVETYDITLGASFVTDHHVVTGTISNWASLTVTLQGISVPGGAISPQVSFVDFAVPFLAAQSVSGTDSGSGSETQTVISVTSSTDSGSDSEIQTVQSVASSADSGSESESQTVINVTSNADSGSGSETQTVKNVASSTDSGTESELASLALTPAAGESGSEVENTLISAAISAGSDSGASTESGSPQAVLSSADSGSASESLLRGTQTADSGSISEASTASAQIPAVDAFTLAEIISLVAKITVTDSGAITDVGQSFQGVVPVSGSDSYTFTDSQTLSAVFSNADSASDSELGTLLARVSSTDSAGLSEVISLLAQVASSDSGTDSESANAVVLGFVVSGTDSGTVSEITLLLAKPISSDSGSATDLGLTTVRPSTGDFATISESHALRLNVNDLAAGTTDNEIIRAFLADVELAFGTDLETLFREGMISVDAPVWILATQISKPTLNSTGRIGSELLQVGITKALLRSAHENEIPELVSSGISVPRMTKVG